MKSDSQILFSKLRDVSLRKPYHSKKYIEFVMANGRAGDTFHHVFGSVHGMKSTDLLGVAVPAAEHSEHQDDPEWLLTQVPIAIENLLKYVDHLETLIEVHHL